MQQRTLEKTATEYLADNLRADLQAGWLPEVEQLLASRPEPETEAWERAGWALEEVIAAKPYRNALNDTDCGLVLAELLKQSEQLAQSFGL